MLLISHLRGIYIIGNILLMDLSKLQKMRKILQLKWMGKNIFYFIKIIRIIVAIGTLAPNAILMTMNYWLVEYQLGKFEKKMRNEWRICWRCSKWKSIGSVILTECLPKTTRLLLLQKMAKQKYIIWDHFLIISQTQAWSIWKMHSMGKKFYLIILNIFDYKVGEQAQRQWSQVS